MTSELKPCPFCGGKAKYTEDNGEYQNHITCRECNFRMSGEWLEDPTTILRWNTRAVPDVPELVRYRPANYMEPCLGGMFSDKSGSYVRYDQAAAVIAELKRRNREIELEHTGVRNSYYDERRKVVALESELAQIKAQDPVGYISNFSLKALKYKPDVGVSSISPFVDEDHSEAIYAAPVDQTETIIAELEAILQDWLNTPKFIRGYATNPIAALIQKYRALAAPEVKP